MFAASLQIEQRKKLAFDLFSCRNYRDAVKQRFVCGRVHAIPHDIHYRCTAGSVGMIGK